MGFVFAFRARHSVIMTVGCIWLTKGGLPGKCKGKLRQGSVGEGGAYGFRVSGFRVPGFRANFLGLGLGLGVCAWR